MKKRILSLLLAFVMVISIFPSSARATDSTNGSSSVDETGAAVCDVCGNEVCTCETTGEDDAAQTPDYSGDIGKYVKLNEEFGGIAVRDGNTEDVYTFEYTDFAEGTVMKIDAWEWESGTTGLWYQVSIYAGGVVGEYAQYWPETPWILQNYTVDGYDVDAMLFVTVCGVCGKAECTTEHKLCAICGAENCTKDHTICEACGEYCCQIIHLYCNACNRYDCTENHVWCGICAEYDCGITHESLIPATQPVIPEDPARLEGVDVTVVDGNGDPVMENGVTLAPGTKSSLSAWTDLEGTLSYRWQICYDSANDLWTDIRGQNAQGILISPAMFLNIVGDNGAAEIRCVITNGETTQISEAVSVKVASARNMGASSQAFGSSENDLSVASDGENKVNLIVNYVFTDGKIAASPWAASLPAGVAYSTPSPITIPTISGYTPVVDEGDYKDNATLNGYQLSLAFSAEELENNCVVTIVYQPAPVKVVVEHYQQNVENDNYTLFETDNLSLVTGTQVGNVHKNYDGFYSLLYEHPTVAADGSTLIQVYYDRYYYLITFDLSGGYGVDPIYARYGTPIEIGTPTRAGYTYAGWTLNGETATIPDKVPAQSRKYVAVWNAETTSYDVVFWYENANNDRYAQAGVLDDIKVSSGTIVNGSDYRNTAFEGRDSNHFTFSHAEDNVEVNGDGSTVINVYFTRNVYDLTFVMEDLAEDCTVPIHASHSDYTGDCYVLVCDKAHIHDESCNRTLKCTTTEHASHAADCLICTKPIHPEHTLADCYVLDCDKNTHNHTTEQCTLACNHAHELDCYKAQYGELVSTDRPNATLTSAGNGIYTYTTGWLVTTTHYYLNIGDKWYCSSYRDTARISLNCNHNSNHDDSCYTCGETQGTHTHTVEAGCYNKTCEKEIHAAHTDAAGCYKDVVHIHDNTCYTYECGVLEHTHTAACYELTCDHLHYHQNGTCYLVISRKYDADISDVWKENPVKAVIDNGDAFKWSQTSAQVSFMEKMPGVDSTMTLYNYSGSRIYHWFYYLEALPGTDTTGMTTRTDDAGRVYVQYDDTTIRYDSTLYLTYDDDYYPITGFTQLYKKGEGGWYKNGSNYRLDFDYDNSSKEYRAYLLYTRNSYDLSFSNYGVKVPDKGGKFYYQADISNQYFKPDYPDTLEDGAYEFEGWYTSPFFGNSRFEFTTTNADGTVEKATMPAESITLYANWIPVSRRVRFFLDRSDMEAEVTIPERMDILWKETHDNVSNPDSPYENFETRSSVPNKSFIADVTTPGVSTGYENHPYNGYTFVGWFYVDEHGAEKAFDPANMPVTNDLDLYGKWSSNVLCPYEIYFALDADGNGVADTDSSGKIIYVADPVTGSTLAGNSRTFDAKGDTALYVGYQSGYFPNVASHTIDFKASDEDGVVYTFLYKPNDPVSYTVKYLEEGTNAVLAPQEEYPDNTKAVVTENFKPISGYMPDAYQKTLVVVPGGENEIIFYYTKDTKHALYQVNHYTQNLDGGWTEYRSATFTGEIGKDYSASAETIIGFTFSDDLTRQYNTEDKINAYTNTALPGEVDFSAPTDTVTGTLSGKGMQLNLYYTRNVYTYKVQYLEFGTEKVLHPEKTVQAKHNEFVSENAVRIEIDLDGDGRYEEFQLYEATQDPQTATIKDNSTVLKFYYVRCTQDMTVTKNVVDKNPDDKDVPNPEQAFAFLLTIHANDFHQESYRYEIKKGSTIVDSGYNAVSDDGKNQPTMAFSLKAGETIKFFDLPTAEYTVTELALPTGYYNTSGVSVTKTLTVDAQVDVTVVNSFEPANLTVSKTVNVVEEDSNTPEVTDFAFTIQVPTGVTGSYSYIVGNTTKTATVSDDKLTVTLQNGQSATFLNLPTGAYTVTETDYSAFGYDSNYSVNGAAYTEGETAQVTLARNSTQTVDFMNKFPVGDLLIEKTVNKQFYGTKWEGDTFTFTVERTTAGRPLVANNRYKVLLDGVEQTANVAVDANGKLTVTIPFSEFEAAQLTAVEDDRAVTHTLTIKNLPTGTYTVKETEDADYVQSPDGLTVSGLTIPGEEIKASFTNTVIRKTGDLYLEKELVAASGFNPDELPKDTKFSFTVELLEGVPEEDQTFAIAYTPVKYSDDTAAATTVIMSGGKFTVILEADQNMTVSNLPEGKYRITEATIPYYANAFAHRENGNWVEKTSTTTAEGQMYTEIAVEDSKTAEVKCTNTYPVSRAELIIQKLVTKEYERDTLPDDSFVFTVKLNEQDKESYTYKVYDDAGNFVREATATVSNYAFTVTLKAGQYAVIPDMPVCGYTVSEAVSADDYTASYKVYVSDTGKTASTAVNTAAESAAGTGALVSRTFAAGKTEAIVFTNEYMRHLGTLTITKKVVGTTAKDTFIFHVKGNDAANSHIDMDVTITGSGSVTIYDLPLGSYTVTEDTDWNWRYTTPVLSISPTLAVSAADATVEFTNTYKVDQWLTYRATMPNTFGKKEDEQEGS